MLLSTFILYLIVVFLLGVAAALAFIYGYRCRQGPDARLADEVAATSVTGQISDQLFAPHSRPDTYDDKGAC